MMNNFLALKRSDLEPVQTIIADVDPNLLKTSGSWIQHINIICTDLVKECINLIWSTSNAFEAQVPYPLNLNHILIYSYVF
jgi:hypothetical protein